jgi:hypothetical protein
MELNSIQNNEPKFAKLVMEEFVQKKSHWTIVGITIGAVITLFVIWWYVAKMKVEAPVTGQPQTNQEAREDAALSGEIQQTDLGNVDAEFESIDSDLNSL